METKTCIECKKEFKPSSRHRRCPSCRKSHLSKGSCAVCGTEIWYQSTYCRAHGNTEVVSRRIPFVSTREHKSGYVRLYAPGHPKSNNAGQEILEHVYVMEQKLGRYLLPGENVHHVNGVRNDNRIENLELWIKPQPIGIRARDAVEWAKQIIELYGDL